jgi:hypothetical protein
MFTQEYILFCCNYRHLFSNKKAKVGDWYLDTKLQTLAVLSETDNFDSISDSVVYIPDLDDLFELLNNQITFTGASSEQCLIKINQEKGKWSMEIHQPAGITFIGEKESLHLALFRALFQMSTLAPKNLSPLKNSD